jgi:glucose/mannose-6-phosphate isomerase
VIDLDDAASLSAADPGGMFGAVGGLAGHCRVGFEAGREAAVEPAAGAARAIVFCGMGGSGVAGEVIRTVYPDRLPVPVVVVRGPELPAFCGADTFAVVSSYSGGTAETLAAFDAAVDRGCRVAVVTSGGELARRAADAGSALVEIPAGFMPRAAFGFLAFAALGVLESAGMLPPIGEDVSLALSELEPVLQTLGPSVPTAVNEAKRVAVEIGARVPVIWGEEGLAATAAGRWKTQMNENAKVPAVASALPELDHNEVVGWSDGLGERFAVVALRHEGERPDDSARFGPSLEIAAESGARTREVWARGSSPLSRFLSLVATGDHASTYLGVARGVDPTPIEAIVRLKRALSEA